jgi:hypothetical protein
MSNRQRPSLLGALLWIGIGLLFLLSNLGIGRNFWSLAGRWWPVLLILFGLGKVIEYYFKKDAFSIRIGEILGVFFLVIFGSVLTKFADSHIARVFRELPIEIGTASVRPGQWIGESHTYTEEASYPLERPGPIRIVNSYGLVSVSPGSDSEIRVRLKKVVYAQESRARQIASDIHLEASPESALESPATAKPEAEPGKIQEPGWFVVKTNRESVSSGEKRFDTDLEVLIPRNSQLEVINTFGEVEVSGINGAMNLSTTHRPLEVRDCTGPFTLSNRYGESRLTDLTGNVVLEGRGKAYVENIRGDVTVTNEYSPLEIINVEGKVAVSLTENSVRVENATGPVVVDARGARVTVSGLKNSLRVTASHQSVDISDVASDVWIDSRYSTLALRDIKGSTEITSNSDRVTAEEIGGSLKLKGRASGVRIDGIRGPLDVQTSLKDVIVNDVADRCSITNEYADISLSAEKLGKGDMQIINRNGSIDLSLPEGASFVLNATARNGEIESDYAGLEPAGKEGTTAVLKSRVKAGGPTIVLETQYDNIRITGSEARESDRNTGSKSEETTVHLNAIPPIDASAFGAALKGGPNP